MSLVGSLEDLGLGDILQIVSLSRKSGLLLIHSEQGEGRIVFCDGLVRAAYVKGEPEDLRSLLVESDFLGAEDFDRARKLSSERGVAVDEVLPECTSLTSESLDCLRREHVERAVFRIFSWVSGEFSFEVREQIDARDLEIVIQAGINAQYLTMEATRLVDEGGCAEGEAEAAVPEESSAISAVDDGPIFFSGEAGSDEASDSSSLASARETAEPTDAVEPEITSAERDSSGDAEAPEDVLALAATRREAPELEVEERAGARVEESPREEAPSRPGVVTASLIAIDPNLRSLEWQKQNLSEIFPRVHIFQNGESGIARIRQYLRRGEIPVVLVSIDLAAAKISGVESLGEFIRRIKLFAPSMPVLIARYETARSDQPVDSADAIVTGPNPALLADQEAWPTLTEEAERLRTEIAGCLKQPVYQGSDSKRAKRSSASSDAEGSEKLRNLRAVSERIRDPANQGEVLKLVLEFASETLSRVAMFMVRDEIALGVAQIGLPSGGGPDDAQFREIELPAAEVEWFQHVLEARTAFCSPATGDGDRALACRIGDREPAQAYIAPVLSGGQVVALLYADNLPGAEPIGDTSVIEIALHEAGLALERALLKRALSQVGDFPAS